MALFTRDSSFALTFTFFYALILAWAMGFHELWFDETEPWLLALYSDSYSELLYNKRFEGHPNLWYSILFAVTSFTHDLRALQITQTVFAIGFVYLFLRYAPFPKLLKGMICFGYYGLFEYGIISRLYALEMFFLFLVCTFYSKRFSHWYLYIALLAILAQTNLFGFFMTGVLGLLLFSETFNVWKETPKLPVSPARKFIGIAIWATGCLFSFWSMMRPNEIEASLLTFLHPYYFYQTIARIWQSFAPVPDLTTSFWNTSFLKTSVEIVLSALLLALLCAAFYRTKRLLLPLLLLFGALFFLFFLKFEGSMRHHGHYFVYTIALLWLRTYYVQSLIPHHPFKWADKILLPCLYLFGFLQVIAGAYALATDWKHPFFMGKEVAQYLKALPTGYILATDERVATSNITAYLGHPVYNLPTGNLASFYTLDPQEANDLRPIVLLDWAQALAQQKNTPVILVCRSELPYQWSSFPIEFLATFRGNSINRFAFYIYKVNPLPFPKKYMMAEFSAQ
ncbi:hypothetical protein [Rufibacter psychrotolerans]|uniref:hypothetical protein n=1 Tax=Rufibacter psychrotolerans TaxID=2812556 RepID=UPI001967A8A2|nr:hypothetical protein [Rufibacter sp. SYSU D00308]